MSDLPTTEVRLVYLFPDGTKGDLGSGTIDANGHITASDPADGQEDYLAEILAELNAREYVILKEPPVDSEQPFAISKRKVERDDPEFLEALPKYTARIYALELRFDAAAIQPGAPSFIPGAFKAAEAAESGEDEGPAPRSD